MRVQRQDAPNPAKITRLPTGGIRVDAALNRTGIQSYLDHNGEQRLEYRPPEEVFSKETIDSFKGVPVTIGHPAGFVSPDNYQQLAVGHVCDDLAPDGDLLGGSVVVMDRTALDSILSEGPSALREVSCGYTLEIDETPGIAPDGTAYVAIQRNIRGNHLALLPKGMARGGPQVALRLDSALSCIVEPKTVTAIDKPATEVVVKSEQARIDALEGELRAVKSENLKLRTQLKQANDPSRVDSLVTERAALLAVAMPILGDTFRLDGMTSDDVRKAVVAKAMPEERLDGKSSDYIAGLFKGVVSAAERAPAPGLANVRVDAVHARVVDGIAERNDIQDGYAKRLKRDQERCKPPSRSA